MVFRDRRELEERIQELKAQYAGKRRVLVCGGLGCLAKGAQAVFERFQEVLAQEGLDWTVAKGDDHRNVPQLARTGCMGLCEAGPLVTIEPLGILYLRVRPEDVEDIVEHTLKKGTLVERLVYREERNGHVQQWPLMKDVPFYRRQVKIALRNCGSIDPENLDEYLAHDGYLALAKAITEMTPDEVIGEVMKSGLRGRGGGGFPTGRKWQFARMVKADQKYIICNGDEGDPGAFMDRSVMEGDPHSVIEGMAIAGYAIGASEGYIYVRAEYPLAVKRLRKAIEDARSAGLLGRNILGTSFSFDVHIREGAGAFVCGEETALIASIEGKRGMPNPRPPYPAQKGLWGKPTVINNVETLANIPAIILRGAEWFRSFGTVTSPGTKTFALAGKIKNTGLVEVPMGITLRELIFEVGGGIQNDKRFKAVQIGGPSGGCLTEHHLDLPVDYDSLCGAGAIMGSGGLIVLDEDTCIVEVARFFMSFTQSESCGKCVPCREGTKHMLNILQRIVDGKASLEDLALLEETALVVKDASLCGLGKTAPNPVLTTLRYFRDEYIDHVVHQVCPARVCQAMREFWIDPEKCRACGKCARVCPVSCISGRPKVPYVIDQAKCIKCGSCFEACPFDAIVVRWRRKSNA
ncbi:NADH-quinone oxidoreductase subunit NuoF [Candidatus Caldatribacterium sp.]|uniref:NADH-quinone oxidoreductase subunit NuoF n=1 Tax=Candidatus Caldatribacterium sp. TaxID=2282143 RepID=UPI0029926187|nr:NADH-quinone oxidoreductase subunit NuoF [Candidatus Caldatribacterium sp.]MDW8082010.1 NADH-quinone oxidoreductase subunit NuoF [Candidatus Calescibacterium sp.]